MAIKFKNTVIYMVDTETQADELIASARKDTSFILVGSAIKLKEKKEKGEVIDTHYLVELKKQYCDEWEN